jgi:hypothetical protein
MMVVSVYAQGADRSEAAGRVSDDLAIECGMVLIP